MSLVERIERLEKLVGVEEAPTDRQDINRLMESAKINAASLQSLLYDINRAAWLAGLDQYDFGVLWGKALPAIFREAKERGYLRMEDLDILHWTIHRPAQVEIRFADEM